LSPYYSLNDQRRTYLESPTIYKDNYHLGDASEHTTSEAEQVGFLLGLHLIKTERAGRTSFALGTDDKAAIGHFTSDLIQPGQKIALNAIKLIKQMKRSRGSANYSLTFRWTAGHVGIAGNTIADKEAKKAARGASSDKKLLPTLLRRKLTVS
jgi:ribonuclease HI